MTKHHTGVRCTIDGGLNNLYVMVISSLQTFLANAYLYYQIN